MVPSNGMCIGVTPNGCRRQQQAVHALGHGVADHLAGENVGAGRQVRAVLLDAAGGQDHQRIFLQLLRDLGLGEIDEIAGR